MLAPSQEVSDLQRARNLIADPRNWHQGSRHKHNEYCAIRADLFVRGISEGDGGNGWKHVSPYLISAAHEILSKSAEAYRVYQGYTWQRVYLVNDMLGHQATMRMFDRAIELAMQPAEPPR